MWFSSSRPELSELFGQILHEVTTSSKCAMEDAFCNSKPIAGVVNERNGEWVMS
jgi:hypothetical protein